jgi:cell division protein FtsQ
VTILVGLALIAVVGWWVTNSPLFDMRTFRVSGNRHLSDADVARLAGLSRSTNVVWLGTGTVADRIERDPWVLRARVSRTLPGAVAVSIQERKPVAVVESKGVWFLVSADGVILGRASKKDRLPAIEVAGAPTAVGSRISGATPQLIVARALPAGVRRRVAHITTTKGGSLNVILRSGVPVFFGDASQAVAKARALSSLLSWANDRAIRADYIDVQAPAAPALFPASATSG